ncbi:MAG: hypothetical protein PHG78_05565 [Bacteroidales bacterium]|nr:hypothetical protein [Bacteroidales bacterium]
MTKLKDGKTHLADDELVNVTGGDEYEIPAIAIVLMKHVWNPVQLPFAVGRFKKVSA